MSNDPIEDAAAAFEAGDPVRALELLERCSSDDPERGVIEGLARIALGELDEARAALERARALGAAQHFEIGADLRWAEGELALAEWRVADAREIFMRVASEERSAAALDKLALCLDLQDDFEGADRMLVEAAVLDPSTPPPPRLADEDFDAVVAAAVAQLPVKYRDALTHARLVTEPMPFVDLVDRSAPGATPPDLLGLFVGPTLHQLAEDVSAEHPPSIYLFQRNLERASNDKNQLREEIRITLFHELGHLLGLDEGEVDALGLG